MNLSDWRRRIDEIDKKLVKLLNERSNCALEIGKLKQEAKIPLYQRDRGAPTFRRFTEKDEAARRDAFGSHGRSRAWDL